MRYSLGLPWGGEWEGDGDGGTPISGEELATLARCAEEAGFSAVFATDHPAPSRRWLESGGHPTLDPFVALTWAGAATSSIALHTHLLVAAYRNPLLVAKSVASLVSLTNRRVIVGIGAGYLKSEFRSLGADFDGRGRAVEVAIAVMREAWKGNEVGDAVVRPLPRGDARPPVWVGGNSRSAIERAVVLAQGWCPMPSPAASSGLLGTPGIESVEELASRIAYARDRCNEIGRTEPFAVCFAPGWGTIGSLELDESAKMLDDIGRMEEIGVSWVTVNLAGASGAEFRENIERFAANMHIAQSGT